MRILEYGNTNNPTIMLVHGFESPYQIWIDYIDLDTEALLKCAEEKRPLFHKPLEQLKTPILFVGSKEDESCRSNLEEEYREMASMLSQSSVYLFPSGGHPSLFSNAEKTADIVYNFIFQQEP